MALTGTYSNGTLSITKATANSEELKLNAATVGAAVEDGWYGSDVTK